MILTLCHISLKNSATNGVVLPCPSSLLFLTEARDRFSNSHAASVNRLSGEGTWAPCILSTNRFRDDTSRLGCSSDTKRAHLTLEWITLVESPSPVVAIFGRRSSIHYSVRAGSDDVALLPKYSHPSQLILSLKLRRFKLWHVKHIPPPSSKLRTRFSLMVLFTIPSTTTTSHFCTMNHSKTSPCLPEHTWGHSELSVVLASACAVHLR